MRALVVVFVSAMSLAFLAVPAGAEYNHTEADACGDCHYGAGSVVMPFTVDEWKDSNHAESRNGRNGNTYCARCHAPFQADPLATYSANEPVLEEDWESVTCGSCHPPHDLRVEWGTPIGIYDVDEADWFPVAEEDANLLCEHCHITGARHGGQEFQGFGTAMEHKDVGCIDCHMAEIPNDLDPGRMTRSHDFLVAANLPYSCISSSCHSNKKEEWAAKQVAKDKIHGK